MVIELKAETERLVHDAICRGDFHSVDEIIAEGVKHPAHPSAKPHKTIYELLTQPPFAGSGLVIERQKDLPEAIDLG